ncbi:MAG: zinc ribbon domain-containing protein [Patescibacteria group bacterium]
MTTNAFKCPNCGASISNFVGLTGKCPYCQQQIRREIQDPDTKQLEEEAALGIDLLRQMKDLNKTHEKFNPEESLVKQAENLYFDSLGWNGHKTCPKCGYLNYKISRFCHICGTKFTDESSEQSLPPQPPTFQVVSQHKSQIEVVIQNGIRQKPCPFCRKNVNVDMDFCGYCGKEFPKKLCTGCGAKASPDARFCPKCGNEFSKETSQDAPSNKLCPQCGEQNLPDAPFCITCGHKFVKLKI